MSSSSASVVIISEEDDIDEEVFHVDASTTMLIPQSSDNDNTLPIYLFDAEEEEEEAEEDDDDMSSLDAAATILSYVSARRTGATSSSSDHDASAPADGEKANRSVTPPTSISVFPHHVSADDDEDSDVQVDDDDFQQVVVSPSSSLYPVVIYDVKSSDTGTINPPPVNAKKELVVFQQEEEEATQEQQQQKQTPASTATAVKPASVPRAATATVAPVATRTRTRSRTVINTIPPLVDRADSSRADSAAEDEDEDDYVSIKEGQRLEIIAGVYKGNMATLVYSTKHKVAVHVDGYPSDSGKPKLLSKSSVRRAAAVAATASRPDVTNSSERDAATMRSRRKDDRDDCLSTTMTPSHDSRANGGGGEGVLHRLQEQQEQTPSVKASSSAKPASAPPRAAATTTVAAVATRTKTQNGAKTPGDSSQIDTTTDDENEVDYAPKGQRLEIIAGVYNGNMATFVYSTEHKVAVHVDGYEAADNDAKPKLLSKSSVRRAAVAAAAASHPGDDADSSSTGEHVTASTTARSIDDQDNDVSTTMTPSHCSHRDCAHRQEQLLMNPSCTTSPPSPTTISSTPAVVPVVEEPLLPDVMPSSSASMPAVAATAAAAALPDSVVSSSLGRPQKVPPPPPQEEEEREHQQQKTVPLSREAVQPARQEAMSSSSHYPLPRGSVAFAGDDDDDDENSEASQDDDGDIEDYIHQQTLVSSIVTPSPPSSCAAAAATATTTTTQATPSVIHASAIRDTTTAPAATVTINGDNTRPYAIHERLYIISGKYKGGMCSYVRSTTCKAFVYVDGFHHDGPKPLDKASVSRFPTTTDNIYGYAVNERLFIVGGTYKGKTGTYVKSTPCKTFVNVDGYTDGPKALNKSSVARYRNGSNAAPPVNSNSRRTSSPSRATTAASHQASWPDYSPSFVQTPPRARAFSSAFPRGAEQQQQQQQLQQMTPATATTLNETRSSDSSESTGRVEDENDSVRPTHIQSRGRETRIDSTVFLAPSIVTPPAAPTTHALFNTVARGGGDDDDDDEYSFLDAMETVENDDETWPPRDTAPATTATTLLRTHRLPGTSSNSNTTQQVVYRNGSVEDQGRYNSISVIFSTANHSAVGAPQSGAQQQVRSSNRLVSGDPIVIVSGVHKGKRDTFIRETATRICAQIDGVDTERFVAPKNIQRAC
jgi:hypothetical protein